MVEQPETHKSSMFDEVQARHRSDPLKDQAGRFGYIDFAPTTLPDLYGPRNLKAEERYAQAMREAQKERG